MGADRIRQSDGVIVDRSESEKLEHPAVGDIREINGCRARVVGFSQGIMGFLVAPYVFTTYQRAAKYLHKDSEVSSYFLVLH